MLSRAYYFPTGPRGWGQKSRHIKLQPTPRLTIAVLGTISRTVRAPPDAPAHSDNAAVTSRSRKNPSRNDARWFLAAEGCFTWMRIKITAEDEIFKYLSKRDR